MTAGARPLLLHVFATFAVGGPQVRFANLANHFGSAYRHLILAMDGDYACRERLSPELDVGYAAIPVRHGDTLANVRQFRRALRDLRPDVLVTSNWGSIEWAIANILPMTRHIHIEDGFGPEERAAQLRRRVLTRRLFLRHSTVAVPSRTLWHIATEIWRLDPARLHYIPNGIDLGRFAGAPEAMPAIWPSGGPVIGTVAALRAEKNLARLLRAFRLANEAHPAHLVIIGDGPERPRLAALAADLSLADRVFFAGHVEAPQRLYASFDLFALSSDTEQMPLSVIEAMAARLPVAATDVGDVRTMLASENAAFVVAPDDAALAGSLRALLGDPGLRRRVGVANRAKAERDFDQEAMFRAYAALLNDALATGRS